MTLSIIILNYNTAGLTIDCLKSIIKQYKKELEEKEFEIILVDNASTDDSIQEISGIKFPIPNLKLIMNKKNSGFAKGCNLGAKSAGGKYLLFLNSDTRVEDDGLSKMVGLFEKSERMGILGGRLLNPDGSKQLSTGKFYSLFYLFLMLVGKDNRKSPKGVELVDWVSGACLMIKRDLFEKLKGFDEHLFMYMEDMELCYSAKKLGFKTYFFPNVMVIHKELGSSSKKFAIINIYKGILYFYKKHQSHFRYNVAKLMLTVKAAIVIVVAVMTDNRELRETYIEALDF